MKRSRGETPLDTVSGLPLRLAGSPWVHGGTPVLCNISSLLQLSHFRGGSGGLL